MLETLNEEIQAKIFREIGRTYMLSTLQRLELSQRAFCIIIAKTHLLPSLRGDDSAPNELLILSSWQPYQLGTISISIFIHSDAMPQRTGANYSETPTQQGFK